jgi:hypothetical protein
MFNFIREWWLAIKKKKRRREVGPAFKDWEIALMAALDTFGTHSTPEAQDGSYDLVHQAVPHQTSSWPAILPYQILKNFKLLHLYQFLSI